MTEILTIKKIRNKARAKRLKAQYVNDCLSRHAGEKVYRQWDDMLFQAYRRTYLRQGD